MNESESSHIAPTSTARPQLKVDEQILMNPSSTECSTSGDRNEVTQEEVTQPLQGNVKQHRDFLAKPAGYAVSVNGSGTQVDMSQISQHTARVAEVGCEQQIYH